MLMRRILLALVAAACALIAAPDHPAYAVPVVDQSNPGSPSGQLLAVSATQQVAQTFTVGISGMLTSVDVFVEPRPGFATTDLLQLGIFAVSGGAPTGSALTSISVAAGAVTGLNSYDFADIAVGAGDVLAIVLSSIAVGPNDYLARPITGTSGADLYAAGSILTKGAGDWTALPSFPALDLIFTTYVDPSGSTAVPEPATILLLGLGAAGIALRVRRR